MPIREALAFTTLHGKHRTFTIRDLASVIAELKFCQITVKVLFGAVLIDALHSAFED